MIRTAIHTAWVNAATACITTACHAMSLPLLTLSRSGPTIR